MLKVSALNNILFSERQRRPACSNQYGGWRAPLVAEWPVEPGTMPIYATGLRGGLVPAKVSASTGIHRLGFFECLPDQEDSWVAYLFKFLAMGDTPSYPHPQQALRGQAARGFPVRSWVLNDAEWSRVSGSKVNPEESRHLMAVNGCVSEFEGVKIQVAPLPDGCHLLAAAPPLAGLLIRSDTHLAVAVWRANVAWGMVRA